MEGISVSHSTLIRSEINRVYDALTTSRGLDAWFTQGGFVDPRPGGEIRFQWVDWGPEHITTQDVGSVVEADSPVRFVFQWHPDIPDYATTVEINLRSVDGGTIVSLCEYGFANTASGQKAMVNCAAGWGEALTLLKFHLEFGVHY